MAKVVDYNGFREDEAKRVFIFCPGCKAAHPDSPYYGHCLNVTTIHKFNGDYEKPTFTPSLMAATGKNEVCHSFVTDGMIRVLDDCTHPLKGQTVPLMDVPDDWEK